MHGAGHEGGRRAGTENVPYMAALGAACALAGTRLASGGVRPHRGAPRPPPPAAPGRRPRPGAERPPERRLPNTLNVSFPGQDGEELLARTPAIAASTGSACHAGRTEPSGVLLAMGIDRERALGAVRLSLGYQTTAEDVEAAARALIQSARVAVGSR